MLVSHRKKFIYTKTVKTASTSVESFFEPLCVEEGKWSFSERRNMHISEHGIIGSRAAVLDNCKWFNHMSAHSIRRKINQEVWNDYFKFTVIRNPFDKMLSGYVMFSRMDNAGNVYLRKLKRQFKGLFPQAVPLTDKQKIEGFRTWLKDFARQADEYSTQISDEKIAHFELPIALSILDQDKYMIDGQCCMDDFIRFEYLYEDIAKICMCLDIDQNTLNLPDLKMGERKKTIPITDYYDTETEAIVRRFFAWEIDRFNYTMP